MAGPHDAFWVLDKLEKHFDRVWVDADVVIGRLDCMKGEQGDEIRGKLHTLSVIFSHLGEKARSVFETNMKQEAEMLHLKDEVSELDARNAALEKELEGRLLQLHAAQVQLQSYMRTENSSELDSLKSKLDSQIDSLKADVAREARLASAVRLLKRENAMLKGWVKEAKDVSQGAKLTARYLDKELAGRLQEVQLLLNEIQHGKNMEVWTQIESEIALNHHKAVVHACRVRALSKGMPVPTSRLTCKQRRVLMPKSSAASSSDKDGKEDGVRNILVVREKDESMGLSIAGGRNHGLPIVVSALEPGMAAARAQGLYIGDTILAVNGQDLRTATHGEAVDILQKEVGEIQLDVMYLDVSDNEDNEGECEESNGPANPRVGWTDTHLAAGYHPILQRAEATADSGFASLALGQSYHLSSLTDSSSVFNSDYTF